MRVRRIEDSDFAACVDIFNEAFNELHRAYGFVEDLGEDDEWLLKPLQHFLHTDPDGGLIAADEDGEVAFASSFRREGFWFLSFLFVRPRAQQQGIGRRLLRQLAPDGDGVTVATMVESFQAAATGLYASEGMVPSAQKYWLIAKTDSIQLTTDPNLTRSSMSEDDLDDLGALDQGVLGFRRPDDHRWWMQSMSGFTYRTTGRVVGYAYLDDGWIAPALAVDEATLVALFGDVARLIDKTEIETAVFGTSHELFQALIRFGFRIGPSKYSSVYASSRGPLPANYLLHADWLP